ncbi:hypothetical protein F383_25484 [Gossypium arboreum]|uniref:Uncharacterized protein n=1 Tax=Gossypium arboreum TaxID=29729 RepID=A0A0B0P6V8_GOSAR|nr:hypothetical protein F383_25484 [Gossypium arboreum]
MFQLQPITDLFSTHV